MDALSDTKSATQGRLTRNTPSPMARLSVLVAFHRASPPVFENWRNH
jgi:hypothetical protein